MDGRIIEFSGECVWCGYLISFMDLSLRVRAKDLSTPKRISRARMERLEKSTRRQYSRKLL
jgi:hypothetical protein